LSGDLAVLGNVLVDIDIAVDVTIDVAVDVDVHIDIPVIAANVYPSRMPVAVVGDGRANGHPDPKADDGSGGSGPRRRRSVGNGRTVLRDINDFRLRGLDLDDGVGDDHNFLLNGLFDHSIGDDHHLLRSGLEIAGLLRFAAQGLDRVHNILLLIQEGLSEGGRPIQVIVHFVNDRREPGHSFNVGIPRLLVELGQIVGVLYKARCLHDFQRIDRRRQNGRDQRIGIERDGPQQLFQFCGTSLRRS
jgi:hypothetical protein